MQPYGRPPSSPTTSRDTKATISISSTFVSVVLSSVDLLNEVHRLNANRILSHARYAFPLVCTPPHSVNRQTKHSTK